MKVIGITGFARSGKDTFCNVAKGILEHEGMRVKQFSFAAALKNELAPFLKETCGVDVWTNDSELKADIRDILVWYGTTWWRKREPNRWIDNVDALFKKESDSLDYAIVSDIRYPNEADWIHSWGGKLVHVSSYTTTPDPRFINHPHELTDGFLRIFADAPNEQENLNDPLVKSKANYLIQWEHKKMRPEEVLVDPTIKQIVMDALISIRE